MADEQQQGGTPALTGDEKIALSVGIIAFFIMMAMILGVLQVNLLP